MRKLLLAMTVLVALVLVACQPVMPVDSEAGAAAPAAGAIQVTDALGNQVEFATAPQRIVVAGRGTYMVTGALFMFPEAKTRLAAYEGGRFNDPVTFIPLVDPDFAAKTALERNSGPEQIAPVTPDAIILKTSAKEDLGDPLAELGVPIVYVEMESVEQYFADVTTLGQSFDNTARAQEIIDFFQARLDHVDAAVAGLSDADKPSVLLIQYSAEGDTIAFEVPPSGWLQTRQVEIAGGAPVWKDASPGDGWNTVNFEQVAQWNPDKIFVVVYQADAAAVVDELVQSPEWQALDAVKNNEVYGFPADVFTWDSPDPRWILGVTWLGQKIHPELFADVDMQQEVYEFFRVVYGLDDQTIEANIIPVLTGD